MTKFARRTVPVLTATSERLTFLRSFRPRTAGWLLSFPTRRLIRRACSLLRFAESGQSPNLGAGLFFQKMRPQTTRNTASSLGTSETSVRVVIVAQRQRREAGLAFYERS